MSKSTEELGNLIQEEKGERDYSVLTVLVEATRESFASGTEQTERDYDALYARLEGLPLEKIDEIQDAVTVLCGDHEQDGFIRGFKTAMKLMKEIDW